MMNKIVTFWPHLVLGGAALIMGIGAILIIFSIDAAIVCEMMTVAWLLFGCAAWIIYDGIRKIKKE
jgi:hypothetical protein